MADTAATRERKLEVVAHVFAALLKKDFDAVEQLLDQIPPGEKLVNIPLLKRGGTILHVALKSGAPTAIIQRIMGVIDIGWCAVQPDALGYNPLHWICKYRCDDSAFLEIAKIMLETAPKALQCKDEHRARTPVHYAAQSGETAACLQTLLLNEPSALVALSTQDHRGQTPLHVACGNSEVSLDVLEILCARYPDALQMQDDKSCTPLLLAVFKKCNVSIIETLIQYCPEALRITNHRGQTPLHRVCACEFQIHSDVILALVEGFPEALEMVDDEGMTPIATSCHHISDL